MVLTNNTVWCYTIEELPIEIAFFGTWASVSVVFY